MESVVDKNFWQNKKVLITGHTGFKGSWLALWLQQLGAEVIGFALPPPTQPNLFELAQVAKNMHSIIGDVRDLAALMTCLQEHQPEIVFHLAAQPLVRLSYHNPVETYATNVMGTVHLLEAIRRIENVKIVVLVTSDKCYDNKEWLWGYRENEPMGGHDPYSNSKGCAELVIAAYRHSFFHPNQPTAIASVRAGNVIGGGDWAQDRLIPDMVRAILTKQEVHLRNPNAVRPWQHVLDTLSGYLLLAQQLGDNGQEFAEAWNFGPLDAEIKTVQWMAEHFLQFFDQKPGWTLEKTVLHEAHLLKLDCSKARTRLGWYSKLDSFTALEWVADWVKAYQTGQNVRELTIRQINQWTKR